ncbi:MAG: glucose-1-phosphate cytidylyltransferase [Phycisphaerales bacterium JB063]
MKVVLFCGGMGMRMREASETIPKPMVSVGSRPILWHVMKYYAHFGHRDFILCLGWQANAIKDYFLHYEESVSNDFVLHGNGKGIELLNRDIDDWNITFVDTGIKSNIGDRLMAVRPFLEGEDTFLANYTDGVSDLHLPDLIDFHHANDAVATFASVRPQQSFHLVDMGEGGEVASINTISQSDVWMNGGFFVLQKELFDYMRPGEDMVLEPFERLTRHGRLFTVRHRGFWGCMDTFKEKQALDDRVARGDAPWELWKRGGTSQPAVEVIA